MGEHCEDAKEGGSKQYVYGEILFRCGSVLLYGSDTWVITERDWKRLRSFHKRAI